MVENGAWQRYYNPAALVPHSIPEPAPGELALLHQALTELIAEAEAHADGP